MKDQVRQKSSRGAEELQAYWPPLYRGEDEPKSLVTYRSEGQFERLQLGYYHADMLRRTEQPQRVGGTTGAAITPTSALVKGTSELL